MHDSDCDMRAPNDALGEWTGGRELQVTLGYGALAIPDETSSTTCSNESSIVLRDGGVRTEASAVLSSTGCTPMLFPNNPPVATAVLVGPQVGQMYKYVKPVYMFCLEEAPGSTFPRIALLVEGCTAFLSLSSHKHLCSALFP